MRVDVLVRKTAELLADSNLQDNELEQKVLEYTKDASLARRLIDWIPEIFGFVLVKHCWNLTLPKTFSAQNRRGEWESFEFKMEPCIPAAFNLATELFHSGDRSAFGRIAQRSSVLDSANRAANAGEDLDGAEFGSLSMLGIPAEFYRGKKAPWLKSLFKG